jgi:hypothetical protein
MFCPSAFWEMSDTVDVLGRLGRIQMGNSLAALTIAGLIIASAAQANEKCAEPSERSPIVLAECVRLANDEIEVLKEEKEMLKSNVCLLYLNLRDVAKGAVSASLLAPPKYCTPGRSR